METALSLLISYLAGNFPTLKDIIIGSKTMHSHLKKCFKKAVERWNYSDCAKDSMCQNMDKYLIHLKEYITLEHTGRHSIEYELLQLWAEEIMNDPNCCQFIDNLRNEEILRSIKKHKLKQLRLSKM